MGDSSCVLNFTQKVEMKIKKRAGTKKLLKMIRIISHNENQYLYFKETIYAFCQSLESPTKQQHKPLVCFRSTTHKTRFSSHFFLNTNKQAKIQIQPWNTKINTQQVLFTSGWQFQHRRVQVKVDTSTSYRFKEKQNHFQTVKKSYNRKTSNCMFKNTYCIGMAIIKCITFTHHITRNLWLQEYVSKFLYLQR